MAQRDENPRGGEYSDVELEEAFGLASDVVAFLKALADRLIGRDTEAVRKLYEVDFNQITEKLYPHTLWADIDIVSRFYTNYMSSFTRKPTQWFDILYRELYYRHLFSKCPNQADMQHRVGSWGNYHLLMEYFVSEECTERPEHESIQLPSQWLWDMFDEFVYQYHEAQRWRLRFAKQVAEAPEEERKSQVEELRRFDKVWRGADVFAMLHEIARKAGASMKPKHHFPGDNVPNFVLLCYFSKISLLRLCVLTGNYRLGVQVVNDLEFNSRSLHWRIPACHVTLTYYLGFAYMMLRRYQDAIRVFSNLLLYASKSRAYLSSQSYQQEAMTKTVDRIYLLVMLCHALSPAYKLEESIAQYIADKHPEKLYKLQAEDDDTYANVFKKACPKFVDASIPENEKEFVNIDVEEIQNRQQDIFMKDVNYQKKVANVRSFAKLYNNLSLSKLASLMGVKEGDSTEVVRSEMLCVKHRARQQVWREGDLLSGDVVRTLPDVDFHLENEMIHVKSAAPQRSHADYFLKQITRTQEAIQALSQATGPVVPVGGNERGDRRRE